jgi:hypothetical protein
MLEIVIWVSPVDLDDLEKTLNRLNIGKDYLSADAKGNVKFNVQMCISDEIIDWSATEITKEECTSKFLSLKSICDWAGVNDFKTTTTICGCTSMRKQSATSDSKWYLWLDTDIVYDPLVFPHMINSIQLIENSAHTKFVITPEIVRQWDSTWDCLVSDKFINKPVGYQAINNPYLDTEISEEDIPELIEIRNNVPGQPYMKFAGGWFAVISKALLNETPFPENYGHYGLDDTYVMWFAHILNKPDIKQFKMKNIVVCENYFDRITTYKDKVKFIDRREEFKKYNEKLFYESLNNLNNKINGLN